jgi:hypothetical protein
LFPLYSCCLLGNRIIIKKTIVKLKEQKAFKGKFCSFRAREHDYRRRKKAKVPIPHPN